MSVWQWVALVWLATGLLVALNAELMEGRKHPRHVRVFLWPFFAALGPLPMYLLVVGSIVTSWRTR